MNLWKKFTLSQSDTPVSQGFSMRFEKGIDSEFRKLCLMFSTWLRRNYRFPVHLNIYIKNCKTITLMDGSQAYGGFRYFETKPPYIRIPAQIDPQEYEDAENIEIYYSILGSLVHELAHYFQWAAGMDIAESQANYYRFRIIRQFCEACGLPF